MSRACQTAALIRIGAIDMKELRFDIEAQEFAFQRAVENRMTAPGLDAKFAGQRRIAGQNGRFPAGKLLAQPFS